MKNVIMLLLLSSCSLLKSGPGLSENSKNVPEWIYAPYETCREEAEFCATGEAKSFTQADAEARKNLASIFEVRVQSDLNVHTTSGQSFPWQGQVRQEVEQSLKESVDEVLEAVEITKRHHYQGLSYSLASLDRAKASELIGARLKRIDDELNTLWEKKSRTKLRRIFRLYLEREKLNERFSLVSGTPLPPSMSYKELQEWKQFRSQPEPLSLRIGQAPDWLTEKIKELLTEAGFKIVKGEASKVLALNVDSIKEYLNVEGFEKYTFTLTMTSFEKGEKNKVISVSETVTGRSQADALFKVKDFFSDYIEQHLSDLHLD